MPPAIIAAGIGAGGMLGGALIGKKGQSNAIKSQEQLAQQLLAERKPAYDASYNYYNKLLSGDPGAMQAAIAPEINLTNQQYQGAFQNLLNSSMARGGALERGERQLEQQRAAQLSNLYYGLRPEAARSLGALASGNMTNALGALQGASASKLAQSQLNAQAVQGIGGFLANLLATPGLFGGSSTTPSGLTPNDFAWQGPRLPEAVIDPNVASTYTGLLGGN